MGGEGEGCEESCSQGAGFLIRIRVRAGPASLQSRDHLASGGPVICGSQDIEL